MKKKSLGFKDIFSRAELIDTKQYVVHRVSLEHRSSNTMYFNCPFCNTEVKAYVWSICGGGKRCDCGALFGRSANAYQWKK